MTPVKTPLANAPVVTDSPGNWRHPRLDEIMRRRNATTFSESNVRRIAYNLAALVLLWALQRIAQLKLDPQLLASIPTVYRGYLSWLWFAIKSLPFIQIAMACLPLLRAPDDLSDIPLTATQRKLLGLPPSSAPPMPDARYSTPPRYSRTPSIAGSVGSKRSYSSSPLSGRGSPAVLASSENSPSFFNTGSSPLLQKSMVEISNGRRSSFGSASPFAASSTSNLLSDSGSPTSPSPSTGKRASVGLNSKWLYERSRRASGNAWLH